MRLHSVHIGTPASRVERDKLTLITVELTTKKVLSVLMKKSIDGHDARELKKTFLKSRPFGVRF